MTTRRRFALAALLAALCAPFAMTTPAQADAVLCFTLNRVEHCMKLPGPFYEWPRPPHWIDPGPRRVLDVSRITGQLRELVGGEATQLFVTDALGQQAFVIDLEGGVALDFSQNVAQ